MRVNRNITTHVQAEDPKIRYFGHDNAKEKAMLKESRSQCAEVRTIITPVHEKLGNMTHLRET